MAGIRTIVSPTTFITSYSGRTVIAHSHGRDRIEKAVTAKQIEPR